MTTIGHFPAQPHCFAYGGFDIQMNRAIDVMEAAGVASVRVNPWDQSCGFGIAHFWGGDDSHTLTLRFCKERGIGTVFSVLLPNPPSRLALGMRARGWARRLLKGRVPFTSADAVTVINDAQAQVAEQVLAIPRANIWVVPTIVDAAFFENETSAPVDPCKPILCVGTIGTRKNQLRLLQAAIALPNDVVLCGRFDDAEPGYRAAIEREIAAHPGRIRQVQDLPAADLRILYSDCSVLACISQHETEPASVLEAMICNRSTVVADRSYGLNPKFAGAHRCDPDSIASIQNAIREAVATPKPSYPRFVANAHRTAAVSESYRLVYADVARRTGREWP